MKENICKLTFSCCRSYTTLRFEDSVSPGLSTLEGLFPLLSVSKFELFRGFEAPPEEILLTKF